MKKKKIYSGEPEFKEILAKLSRTTKWRAKKRGWIIENYNKTEININKKKFNISEAYNAATKCAQWYARQNEKLPAFLQWDDIIQDAVFKCYLLSGESDKHRSLFGFY